jgi:hypothetical protein
VASTTDNTMASTDELNLEAFKNQILCTSSRSMEGKIKSDCIRIIKGDKIDNHTITTAYDKNTKSWRAVIWDDSNDVFLATTAFTETLVADMYKLLRMTSVIVNSRMDSWEAKHKKGTFHILGGIMYT